MEQKRPQAVKPAAFVPVGAKPRRRIAPKGGAYVLKQTESLISNGFRAYKKSTIILSKLRWTFFGADVLMGLFQQTRINKGF